MATKIDGQISGCIFQWEIENLTRFWWLLYVGEIESPPFIADAVEGTKWRLRFDSNENGKKTDGDIGVSLFRDKDCSGPDIVEVKFQLRILTKDNSLLSEYSNLGHFKKDKPYKIPFEALKVFFMIGTEFFRDGPLMVQCTLQKAGETIVKSKHLYARTVWKRNRKSFDWKIDKFSAVQPEVRKNYKDDFIEFDLVFNKDTLSVDGISSFKNRVLYLFLQASIIDSEGTKRYCGLIGYAHHEKMDKSSHELRLSELLGENESLSLPNDVLSLHFELSVFTMEHFSGEKYKSNNQTVGKEKSECMAVLVDEMKSLCNDGVFCDTELRTSTKTFPAHKAILSARSPVFRSMFSHDMKEKNSGHVDIADFEDDIVHQMLMFVYTAELEDQPLESASKLYAVADKYDILTLKCRCSTLLKQNLSPENACDVLVLADLHNDCDLKNAVEDYILEQRKQILISQNWKHLMREHSKLAADIMYKKMCQELDVSIMR